MGDQERRVERETVLEAPSSEVWDALTDERLLGEWLADEAELEPVPGGRASFRFADGSERRGTVLEVEEEQLPQLWLCPERFLAGSRGSVKTIVGRRQRTARNPDDHRGVTEKPLVLKFQEYRGSEVRCPHPTTGQRHTHESLTA